MRRAGKFLIVILIAILGLFLIVGNHILQGKLINTLNTFSLSRDVLNRTVDVKFNLRTNKIEENNYESLTSKAKITNMEFVSENDKNYLEFDIKCIISDAEEKLIDINGFLNVYDNQYVYIEENMKDVIYDDANYDHYNKKTFTKFYGSEESYEKNNISESNYYEITNEPKVVDENDALSKDTILYKHVKIELPEDYAYTNLYISLINLTFDVEDSNYNYSFSNKHALNLIYEITFEKKENIAENIIEELSE